MNDHLRAPLPALRLAVLALLLVSVPWWIAPSQAHGTAAPAAPATPVAAPQDDPLPEGKFREEVRKAAAIGDQQAVATLMRNNPRNTVAWIITTNEMFSDGPNEALTKDMNLLRTGWRAAFSTGFFDKVEAFFAGLRPQFRRTRNELRNRFNELQTAFDRILSEKASDDRTARALDMSLSFESLGQSFREIGDRYYSSNAFGNGGYLVDSTVVGDQADLIRAHTLLKLALEERLQLELEDRILRNLRIDVARLEPYAVPPEGSTEGGSVDTTSKLPGVGLGPVSTVTGTFEPVPTMGAFERLGYGSDDVYMVWSSLVVTGEVGSTNFAAMKDGPTVRRTGSAAAEAVGTDGSVSDIPVTGNVELVQTVIGDEQTRRPWAFLVTVPTDKEQYQGFELNYQPTKTQLILPVAPAASMVFDVGGTRVRVLDENMDGIYGGPETSWTYTGVVEGEFQIDMDAVVVGSSKRAVPFSELMQIGDGWFRLEPKDGGKNLNVESATLRTGKVKLDMKGVSPHSVIVRGTGALAGCFYDLMANRGTADLPIGTYELVQGVVREGKRLNVQKCMFLGTGGQAIFSVQEGKTTTFALGAPFDISFKADVDESTATIRGHSLSVTGRGGERYHRLWGYTLRPEITLRKAGTKKGGRPERMPLVLDQSTVNEKGLGVAWYPLDMTIEHGLGTDQIEIQLTEKKHALFGKLESTWK